MILVQTLMGQRYPSTSNNLSKHIGVPFGFGSHDSLSTQLSKLPSWRTGQATSDYIVHF